MFCQILSDSEENHFLQFYLLTGCNAYRPLMAPSLPYKPSRGHKTLRKTSLLLAFKQWKETIVPGQVSCVWGVHNNNGDICAHRHRLLNAWRRNTLRSTTNVVHKVRESAFKISICPARKRHDSWLWEMLIVPSSGQQEKIRRSRNNLYAALSSKQVIEVRG